MWLAEQQSGKRTFSPLHLVPNFSPRPVSGLLQEAILCVTIHVFLSLSSIAKTKHLLHQEAFQIFPVYPSHHSLGASANPVLALSYVLCGCSASARAPHGLGTQWTHPRVLWDRAPRGLGDTPQGAMGQLFSLLWWQAPGWGLRAHRKKSVLILRFTLAPLSHSSSTDKMSIWKWFCLVLEFGHAWPHTLESRKPGSRNGVVNLGYTCLRPQYSELHLFALCLGEMVTASLEPGPRDI